MTLGLLTWPLAFNLGEYGDIFYDDIFRVVVASLSILFLITIANSGYPSPWYRLTFRSHSPPHCSGS